MPDGIQIDYDGLNPEQCGTRRRHAGAKGAGDLASRLHRLVEIDGTRGLSKAPPSICAPRSASAAKAGPSSASPHAGISMGILLAPAVEAGPFRSAPIRGGQPGRTCPANTGAMLRRLLVIQGDTEPASWSSSVTSAPPLRHYTTCATCFRSTWRKAVTCGRWSTCCRSIRPRRP